MHARAAAALSARAGGVGSRRAAAAARVRAFLDRLADAPVETWLRIGGVASRSDARHTLARRDIARIIAAHELQMAAWEARDAVATLHFLVEASAGRRGRTARLLLAAAQSAAEDAALALLASDHARREQVDRLCAPFAGMRGGVLTGVLPGVLSGVLSAADTQSAMSANPLSGSSFRRR